jgi:ABC-2 type transport system ATP-binding protein
LDEPTVGVDPQNRNHIFEVIERLNSEGMTIIYTTHYMEEAERFCDKIAIIDNGAIIAQGTIEELRQISDDSGGVIERNYSQGTNLEAIYLKLTGKELRD